MRKLSVKDILVEIDSRMEEAYRNSDKIRKEFGNCSGSSMAMGEGEALNYLKEWILDNIEGVTNA